MHQRNVSFLDLSFGKLLRQLAVGYVILGNNDEAAGLLVQPVNDAGPQFAANSRQTAKAMQQGID